MIFTLLFAISWKLVRQAPIRTNSSTNTRPNNIQCQRFHPYRQDQSNGNPVPLISFINQLTPPQPTQAIMNSFLTQKDHNPKSYTPQNTISQPVNPLDYNNYNNYVFVNHLLQSIRHNTAHFSQPPIPSNQKTTSLQSNFPLNSSGSNLQVQNPARSNTTDGLNNFSSNLSYNLINSSFNNFVSPFNNDVSLFHNQFDYQIPLINALPQKYPLLGDFATNSQENISFVEMRNDIFLKLYNMWKFFIEQELITLHFQLTDYYRKKNSIKTWSKLNNNCEMFKDKIRKYIEFHKPEILPNVTFFRKKFSDKGGKLDYGYLVVKGDPEKDFKNLSWAGRNIFIMDSSTIGKDVILSGYTYIGPNCKIGDNTHIFCNCFFKENVEVENETFIYRNNYFGVGCRIGTRNEQNGNFNNLPGENEDIRTINFLNKKFRTSIGSFNFFSDNAIVPCGYHLRKSGIYS